MSGEEILPIPDKNPEKRWTMNDSLLEWDKEMDSSFGRFLAIPGRINRITYVCSFFFQLFYIIILPHLLNFFHISNQLIAGASYLIIPIWILLTTIRRLHDIENAVQAKMKAGFIPLKSYSLWQKSDPGHNKYGPPPKPGIDILAVFGYMKKFSM